MVANKVELPLGGGGSSGGIYVRLERNTQFGFSSVADLDPSSGEALYTVTGSGGMVVQLVAVFWSAVRTPVRCTCRRRRRWHWTGKDSNRLPQKPTISTMGFYGNNEHPHCLKPSYCKLLHHALGYAT